MTREECNQQYNPFTKAFWDCVWGSGVNLQPIYDPINSVFYPPKDISTPPYVTKPPASATQAPYQPTQGDVGATIASEWDKWKATAIGANTPFTKVDNFSWPDRGDGPDWKTLILLGVGLFVASQLITKRR